MDVFFINLKRKTAPKAPQKFFARAHLLVIYTYFLLYILYI